MEERLFNTFAGVMATSEVECAFTKFARLADKVALWELIISKYSSPHVADIARQFKFSRKHIKDILTDTLRYVDLLATPPHILADMLEDAGFKDAYYLRWLRKPTDDAHRGRWVRLFIAMAR